MLPFFTYLLQVSAWLVPLYLLYIVLYKRFTFFAWNRYYLLSIALVSFILPLVHYNIVTEQIITIAPQPVQQIIPNTNVPNDGLANAFIPNTITTTTINWLLVLTIIYSIVVALLLLKLGKGLWSIKMLIRAAKSTWTANLSVVHTTDKVPHSSFFQYIFLNEKTKNGIDIQKIIYHEMQHNEKLHTLDVLYCELLKIILWFNPFVYWYKKSLQEVHEFEVDAEMTKMYNEVSYAELLVTIASTNNNTLINTFSTQPLVTRLKMIFNPKTYPMKKLSFLLVVPVVAGLLMAYGNISFNTVNKFANNKQPLTIVIDAGHGGTDAGAIGSNTNEKTISLQLALELQQQAIAAGYNVVMTRTTDTLIALKDRATIIATAKANAFISVHLNASDKDAMLNGATYYVSNTVATNNIASSTEMGTTIMTSLANLKGLQVTTAPLQRNTGIYVLSTTKAIPAVLLECGYITNANDNNYISQTANQKQVAIQIVNGLNTYFKHTTTVTDKAIHE